MRKYAKATGEEVVEVLMLNSNGSSSIGLAGSKTNFSSNISSSSFNSNDVSNFNFNVGLPALSISSLRKIHGYNKLEPEPKV
jgi:hypothetical protein